VTSVVDPELKRNLLVHRFEGMQHMVLDASGNGTTYICFVITTIGK